MKFVIALILTFTSQLSLAIFFAEPYLGQNYETLKLTDLLNVKTEFGTSAPILGLKLGYRSQMGVDLNLSTEVSNGKASITGLTEKSKFNRTLSALQLGVNALGSVKMFLGSSFSNELKFEDVPGYQGFKISGPSYHAGLQFRLLSYLNLGLQYNLHQYNTIEGASYGSGNKTETYFNKIDTQDYSLYFSTIF